MQKQTRNLIFYNLQTRYGDLGDLIINKVLIDRLRRHGSLIIRDIGVPEFFCSELGITPEERSSRYERRFMLLALSFAMRRLLCRRQRLYFILTPGHYYSEKGIRPPITASLKLMLYFLLFRVARIRICRFGPSIGPFSQRQQLVERFTARCMHYYSVRESISENYAREIGIKRVARFPDLAWLLEPSRLANAKTVQQRGYVGFSFRPEPHDGLPPENCTDRINVVLDEVAGLVCGKMGKKLVVFHQADGDHEYCRDLAARYGADYDTEFRERKLDSYGIDSLYSQVSFVFSNRLHVLLFALANGAIPFAIIDIKKNTKITGLFEDAGLKSLIININDHPIDIKALREICLDPRPIQEKIAVVQRQMKQHADQIIERIMASS